MDTEKAKAIGIVLKERRIEVKASAKKLRKKIIQLYETLIERKKLAGGLTDIIPKEAIPDRTEGALLPETLESINNVIETINSCSGLLDEIIEEVSSYPQPEPGVERKYGQGE